MLDIAELHAQAKDGPGRVVDLVAVDRWHLATPGLSVSARAAAEVFRRPGALAGLLPVTPGATSPTHFVAMLGRTG